MDMNQLYTELILEYNKDKTNKRPVENPTLSEHGHNPNCGDDIVLQVKMKDGVIQDLAYTGSGCAISQASTAMMIELVSGRTADEALRLVHLFLDMIRGKITDESQLEELEAAVSLKDISKMPVRVKCAVLGWHTLEEALTKLQSKTVKSNK
jgi:nitrogen fixation NifU-like protein